MTQIHRVEYDSIGGPEVLHWREVTLAPPGPGEVQIKTLGASVNPIDAKIRAGKLAPLPLAFPAQSGRDGMGQVTALGPEVDPAWLGQRVCYLMPRGPMGSWAEAVNLPVALLAKVPDGLPDLTAAALPLAGLSALAVLEAGGIEPLGEADDLRILLHAAAGGVGRIVLQLARLAGASVHCTASEANRQRLMALGAAKVWAYDTGEDFRAARDLDLVIDLMGGALHEESYPCLRQGGVMACLNAAPFTDRAAEFGVTTKIAEVAPNPARLELLLDLAAQGHLKPGPALTLPARDFAKAHSLIETGHLSGKLVLDFRS